jgi:hypothetical protein
LPRLGLEVLLPGVFLDGGLRVAGNVSSLVSSHIFLVAALKLRAPALTHALDVQGVSELQQPVFPLRQSTEIGGRRTLEPLSSLEGC